VGRGPGPGQPFGISAETRVPPLDGLSVVNSAWAGTLGLVATAMLEGAAETEAAGAPRLVATRAPKAYPVVAAAV